ncbi:hypothetical protein P691DRAFT_763740 [Macrolepiota fuliginosa MF-IS2]|uniref:Uncharacterized protein n=1 Tax=Macrolepiota fuliginosa MF-IS2 TaxID=1400762 RepID=A0A9P6BZZ0_9AGAR|nr:hypothetical protein P691DRAFT_763740 [Macrolepiota fuliginosa MF-IS2]
MLFDFELIHVPGVKHKGPDGLLRRRKAEGEDLEDEGEAEEWVEEILSCGVWVVGMLKEGGLVLLLGDQGLKEVNEEDGVADGDGYQGYVVHQAGQENWEQDDELRDIKVFLEHLQLPERLAGSVKTRQSFIKKASWYFVHGGKLWKKEPGG